MPIRMCHLRGSPKSCNPSGIQVGHRYFQSRFVMQNAPISELEMDGVKLQVLNVASETAKFRYDIRVVRKLGNRRRNSGILKIYWAVPPSQSSTYLQP